MYFLYGLEAAIWSRSGKYIAFELRKSINVDLLIWLKTLKIVFAVTQFEQRSRRRVNKLLKLVKRFRRKYFPVVFLTLME